MEKVHRRVLPFTDTSSIDGSNNGDEGRKKTSKEEGNLEEKTKKQLEKLGQHTDAAFSAYAGLDPEHLEVMNNQQKLKSD